jgi:hypothetical protein
MWFTASRNGNGINDIKGMKQLIKSQNEMESEYEIIG